MRYSRLWLAFTKFLCTVLLPACFAGFAHADANFIAPTETLIDRLTDIDEPAPGLDGMAANSGFIGEEDALQFEGGVLGVPMPNVPPTMRELARRGAAIMPQLVAHLSDERKTRLVVGSGDFFMFRYFSNEYDQRDHGPDAPRLIASNMEKGFNEGYTVKVGDVCYALIGQIVNRALLPVRYQPSAGLIVNSPIEASSLVESVRRDWSNLDAKGLESSLIADARNTERVWTRDGALVRLRFYFPDEYAVLKGGELAPKIADFEAREQKSRAQAEGAAKSR